MIPSYAKLALVASIILAILYGAHWLFQRGVDSATLDINKANKASETVADKAERDVLACPAGKWNKEAGKCNE